MAVTLLYEIFLFDCVVAVVVVVVVVVVVGL